jgi:CubicO group peptidase (beta-lactamase class C family)
MRLIEDGIGSFNLKSTVFGTSAILGNLYGTKFMNGQKHYNLGVTDITIQNMLEHTSGWGADSDPISALKIKSAVITDILDNIPLTNSPGTVNFYSNFGYLVLRRVIEQVTSQPYENYVRSNIFNQCQITRMQLADNSGSLPDEVHYYPKAVTGVFRIHQFDSFGGRLATPIDLMRFLVRVDKFPVEPDILSDATLTMMFTPSELNSGYAKGWVITPN